MKKIVFYSNSLFIGFFLKLNFLGKLFVDPAFPPVTGSLYKSGLGLEDWHEYEWKRPYDLVQNPEFFVEGGLLLWNLIFVDAMLTCFALFQVRTGSIFDKAR